MRDRHRLRQQLHGSRHRLAHLMQAEGAAVLIILNEPSLNGALRDPVYVSEDAGLVLRESVCN